MTTSAAPPRTRGKKTSQAAPSASYLGLVRKFPLRPLRSDADYDQAAAIIDALAVRPEGSLDQGEQDYLDTLTLLIKAYDDEHLEPATGAVNALAMLKHLMAECGMRTVDLGRLLGNRGLASLILNGRRQLSKTHLRKLANYFKVSPAQFLGA